MKLTYNKIDFISELLELVNIIYRFVQEHITSIAVEISLAGPGLVANIINVECE